MNQVDTVYLAWEKPATVTEWEWRNEGVPQIKDLYRIWVKWSIILGIPTLITIYVLAPELLIGETLVIVALAVVFPAILGCRMRVAEKQGCRYRLTGKGLHWRSAERGGYHK